MSEIVPFGPVAMPPYLLRRMVALSPTFQSGCETNDFNEALSHTFWKDAEGNEIRPCATINSESLAYRLVAGGGQNYLRPYGTLFLWIAQDVLPEHYDDDQASMIRFANFIGGIVDDVTNIAGADQTEDELVPDSHLSITSVHGLVISVNPEEEWANLGKFWWGAVAVNWGDE